MIAIIDYDAGNLRSVQKALAHVGGEAIITDNPQEILRANQVILPGVGSFGDCMKQLHNKNLVTTVHEVVNNDTPFLGICLGLQLLFESSEESPGVAGLGVLPGKIKKIPSCKDLKIPHIGWNSLDFTKPSPLFSSLEQGAFVYFIHSYYMQPTNPDIVIASTNYGATLPIALQRDNVFATQFHPEKSGDVGLTILENFTRMGGGI